MERFARMELQLLEYEARRLRSKYAGDRFACAVISFDLFVRRLAFRLALA